MDPRFFEQPILNSPYEYPSRHWELDAAGQPTNKIRRERRKVAFITPIPKPQKSGAGQRKMVFDEAAQALGTEAQQYDLTAFIGGVRQRVGRCREFRDLGPWQGTPGTARLLKHSRSHRFGDIRPLFCQVEAVENAIWLTEVAPQRGREDRQVLEHLDQASQEANPGLGRLALKLAKTTVMAMLIAFLQFVSGWGAIGRLGESREAGAILSTRTAGLSTLASFRDLPRSLSNMRDRRVGVRDVMSQLLERVRDVEAANGGVPSLGGVRVFAVPLTSRGER